MAYPVKPSLDYSYTGFQQVLGDNSFPGTYMDADLAEVVASLNATIDFLVGSFRSDGIVKETAFPTDPVDTAAYAAAIEARADDAEDAAAAAAVSEANALDYSLDAAASAADITANYLSKAGNLAGLADLAASRTNLGLGTYALKNSLVFADLPALTVASRLMGSGSAGTALAEITPSYGAVVAGTTFYAASPFSVRQTVQFAPVDSAGVAAFLPGTSVNLNLTSQNIAAGTPFVVEGANGPVSRVGVSTANLTWTGLTASQTNFLFVDIGADGTLTTGFTTLAPVYQQGGTYSTTNLQNTFNISEMIMKVGNGSVATQTYRVFVGEAVCSGSAVTSTVNYALRGRYQSANIAVPAAGAQTTVSHNLGVRPDRTLARHVCLTTEGGWAVGDTIDNITGQSAAHVPLFLSTSRNGAYVVYGSASAVSGMNKTTGAIAAYTPANWALNLIALRGW